MRLVADALDMCWNMHVQIGYKYCCKNFITVCKHCQMFLTTLFCLHQVFLAITSSNNYGHCI